MRKVKLNEDINVSYSNYKPVLKNEKFESSEQNYRIALENIRRTIDATAKSEKARKDFKASLLNGDVPNEVALAIKVLDHVANVKNLTSVDKTKALLGNRKIRANEVEEARKSLSELYGVPVEKFDEIEIDEKITDLADNLIQKSYIAPEEEPKEPSKAEKELENEPTEEEPEEQPEEEPADEEPEPEEEKAEEPAPKAKEEPAQTAKETKTGKAPQELVSDLKARFEEEASKALDFIKKAGYDERAGKKIIESLRTKLTKYNNKILAQEDSLTGDYGFNTKSRAQQAINMAANNSNYIIDSISNKTFLKASPSNIALLGRQAAEDLSTIGKAIKGKATEIGKSKAVQTAGSMIQKGYQTLKGKTEQAVDKIGEKIVKADKLYKEKKAAKAEEKAQAEKVKAMKAKAEPSVEELAKEYGAGQKKAAGSIKKAAKLAKKLPQEKPAEKANVTTATPAQAEKANTVLSGPSGKAGEDRIAALRARATPQYTPPQPPAQPAPAPVAPAVPQIPAPVPQANLPAVAAQPQVPAQAPQPGTPNYEEWKKKQGKKGAAASVDIEGQEDESPEEDLDQALACLNTSYNKLVSSKKNYDKKKKAFLSAMKNKAGI